MGLRDKYSQAVTTAKQLGMEGSAEERDGKLHFNGTVKSEDEKNKIWNALNGNLQRQPRSAQRPGQDPTGAGAQDSGVASGLSRTLQRVDDAVERGARPHRRSGLSWIRMIVAADLDRSSLHTVQL